MGEVSKQVVLDPTSRISDYIPIPTPSFFPLIYFPSLGLQRWLGSKESTCQTGDVVFIPGSVRAPRGGNGNPLQYSIHSNILAWEIPLAEEPGGLESMGLQRVVRNLVTKQQHLGTEGVGGWELNRVTERVGFMWASIPCSCVYIYMCVCVCVCVLALSLNGMKIQKEWIHDSSKISFTWV